jgi:DNA polymerase-1
MSSYGESFLEKIHPFTGRIHADFQQIGTETGRFSCRTPNLQQMPEKFRECISLEPDYKIVVADYSQIELRILAEYSQDKSFLHAFNNDIDLHSATAALMFNLPLEKVGKNSPERFAAKTINFGIAYGMGAGKLMNMLNKGKAKKDRIPLYKARNMLNKYKEGYVDVIRWLERAGNEAYARGYSETILGRRRTFTDVYGEDRDSQIAAIKRQGANTPIQGTNADITKIAMFRLYRELKDNEFKAEIIGQVHDEIVVLAHKSQAGAVKEIVVNSMVNSAQEILTVPVKVDAYVSDIWKKG